MKTFAVAMAAVLAASACRADGWTPELRGRIDRISPGNDGGIELGDWDWAWGASLLIGARHASGCGAGLTIARETWRFDRGAGAHVLVDAIDGGANYATGIDGDLIAWPVGFVVFRDIDIRLASARVIAGIEHVWTDPDAAYRVTGAEYFGERREVDYRASIATDDAWRARAGLDIALPLNERVRIFAALAWVSSLSNGDIRSRGVESDVPGYPIVPDNGDLDLGGMAAGIGLAMDLP